MTPSERRYSDEDVERAARALYDVGRGTVDLWEGPSHGWRQVDHEHYKRRAKAVLDSLPDERETVPKAEYERTKALYIRRTENLTERAENAEARIEQDARIARVRKGAMERVCADYETLEARLSRYEQEAGGVAKELRAACVWIRMDSVKREDIATGVDALADRLSALAASPDTEPCAECNDRGWITTYGDAYPAEGFSEPCPSCASPEPKDTA